MKHTTFLFLLLFFVTSFSFRAAAQEKPWMKYITPSGYYQAGYRITDAGGGDNSFYVLRARVALSGCLFEDRFGKFEYKVQAELASSPKLVDYWVKYTMRDEFGIEFGQFKTPLSLENSEYVPLKLEMIDYSLLVQRFVRMSLLDVSGISSTGRDMGLMFFGKALKLGENHHLLHYEAGIFNGNGINKFDDDHRKDFIARVRVFPLQDLSIAGYYMRSLGYMDEVPIYNDYDYRVLDRYGMAINYDSKYAWLRTEYMAGHTFGWRGEGAYVTAGWKITPTFNVGARCDYFTNNSRQAGHDQWYYTAGMSWYPFHRLRLQLNYMYKQEADRSVTHLVNLMTSVIL